MLNKHGKECNVNGPSPYKNMCAYIFYGFSWIDDTKMPNVWPSLYDMVLHYSHLLNKNKPIPLNKLKNTDYWKAILVQLQSMTNENER